MIARRYTLLGLVLALALGVSGCGIGNKKAHPRNADANNNGFYVDGGPITYQLEVSRELNQFATEDAQYLKGIPSGTAAPTPRELWYGVFLWGKNQTSQPQQTTSNFDIVDTQGTHYFPVKLDPNVNNYAWTTQHLQPLGIEPAPDTTASEGPTQGGLLLFKLPTTVYSNRPLTLEIRSPSGQLQSTISLDL